VKRYPLWGWRRTPYIMLGLVLCAGGSALTPQAAYAIHDGVWWGVPLGFVAFGAWGFGFNFATVSYLSLATELVRHWATGAHGRGNVVCVDFEHDYRWD
jgi:BCD family chlorophyll transporter-like MFS transporter